MTNPTKPTTKGDIEEALDILVGEAYWSGRKPGDFDLDDSKKDKFLRLIDTYTQAKEREARIEQSYRCRELIEANANSPEDADRYGEIVLLDVEDLLDEINGEPSESVKWKMKIDKGFGLRCKKGIHLLELQGCISCKKESKKRRKENL